MASMEKTFQSAESFDDFQSISVFSIFAYSCYIDQCRFNAHLFFTLSELQLFHDILMPILCQFQCNKCVLFYFDVAKIIAMRIISAHSSVYLSSAARALCILCSSGDNIAAATFQLDVAPCGHWSSCLVQYLFLFVAASLS